MKNFSVWSLSRLFFLGAGVGSGTLAIRSRSRQKKWRLRNTALHHPIGLGVEGCGVDGLHAVVPSPATPHGRGELDYPVCCDDQRHAIAGHLRGHERVQDGLSGSLP